MSKIIAIQLLRENKVGLRCPDRNGKHYRWMKRSIEREGMATPLAVRVGTDCEDGSNFYEIIDGHHRLQVLKELGMQAALCNVVEADDLHVLLLQLRLNKGAASKVTDEELALGLKRLMMHDPLCTLVQIARDIPMNVRRVEKVLGLHKIAIGAGISNLVRDGKICLMNAYALAKLPHEEQRDWVDRARTQRPRDFIPACGKREHEVMRRDRRIRMEHGAYRNGTTGENYRHAEYLDHEKEQIARARQGLDPLPMFGQNPCGEVTLTGRRRRLDPQLTFPKQAINPIRQVHDEIKFPNKSVSLPADASALKDEIARMKVFMTNVKKDTHDDAVIAMAAANWHNAKFDMGVFRAAGQHIGRMSARGIPPSGYELLHGVKPKTPGFSEIKIKYTATFDTEPQPISRKGWDSVHGYVEGQLSYCHGDILVWQGRRWNVKHPTLDIGNEFDDAIAAMAWVEEQFDGR